MAKANETLAERVRDAVNRTRLSHVAFASEAKIKARTLEDVLYGISQDPQVSTLQGISTRSGVSLDEIVFGRKNDTSSFTDVAAFLNAYAVATHGKRALILRLVYGQDSYLRDASRDELLQLIKELQAALRPK